MFRTIKIALLVTLISLSARLAHATLMHPNVMGTTVWFTAIKESSPTSDPLPLYGQPAANGDQLIFPTTGNFSSESLDGGPSDQTDGKLSLMLRAKNGFALDSFDIAESGLTVLNGPFGGNAYNEVIAFAVVRVVEVAGLPVNLAPFNVFVPFAPWGGQFLLSAVGGPSYSAGWTGSVHVPLPLDATKVNITLNNNLYAATTGQGTRSFIDKKAFELDVDTRETENNDIPEPATLVLGLVSLLTIQRWKSLCA